MPEPLVSVVTPTYNCAKFLGECIESVLGQTYSNWEYHIVDNASTDETSALVERYASAHPNQIFFHRMEEYLPIVANHNRAISFASPLAKYIKLVFADDVLYPGCLAEMVQAAASYPTAGLICSYATDGTNILWQGHAAETHPYSFDKGTVICRQVLLGHPYIFGTGTSTLYRADLVRKRQPFYQPENLHADLEVCIDLLQESDFIFIHQILSYSRDRSNSTNARASAYDSHMLGNLTVLLKYGPQLLLPNEQKKRLSNRWKLYYRILGRNLLRLRGRDFWTYHRERLAQLGFHIDVGKLIWAGIQEIALACMHPLDALDGVRHYWRRPECLGSSR